MDSHSWSTWCLGMLANLLLSDLRDATRNNATYSNEGTTPFTKKTARIEITIKMKVKQSIRVSKKLLLRAISCVT